MFHQEISIFSYIHIFFSIKNFHHTANEILIMKYLYIVHPTEPALSSQHQGARDQANGGGDLGTAEQAHSKGAVHSTALQEPGGWVEWIHNILRFLIETAILERI